MLVPAFVEETREFIVFVKCKFRFKSKKMALFLGFAEICEALEATPTSRNLREGQDLVNAKHLILCEAAKKTIEEIEVYALCLKTSGLTEPPHCITGLFKIKNNEIVRATNMLCTCKAGTSRKCKHISATLLYCSRNDVAKFNILSLTDKKCTWNARKGPALESYQPVPLRETNCFKDDSVDPRILFKSLNKEHVMNELIKACPNSALAKHKLGRSGSQAASSLNIETDSDELYPNSVMFESKTEQLANEIEFLKQLLTGEESKAMIDVGELDITPLHDCCSTFYSKSVVCTNIEQLCLESRYNNNSWKKERQFRITGSTCYALFTYKQSNWVQKSLKYFWPEPYTNLNLQHGIAFEKVARDTYKETYKCEIAETGLIVSKINPWLGYSPDGIIMKNGKPQKLLEIKCIVKGKEDTVIEAAKYCKYITKKDDNEYTLKCKHAYYGQIQLGMAMLYVKETDFVIFASKDNSFININVAFDENFAREMFKKTQI